MGDLIVFWLSIPLVYFLEFIFGYQVLFLQDDLTALAFLGLVNITFLYVGELYNYYLDFRRPESIGKIILWALASAFAALLIFCGPTPKFLPRRFLEWQAVAFIWLLVFWRYSFSALALPRRLKRKLIIVGAGSSGRSILEALTQRPHSGFEPVGFVDDDPAKAGTSHDGVPVLGDATSLESLVARQKVNLVVVAITQEKSPLLLSTLTHLGMDGVSILDMPSFYEFLARKVPIDHISDTWLFLNSLRGQRVAYRQFRRLVDLFLAVAGLIGAAPVLLLIAAAIKSDSKGPVFFLQDRLGKDARPFRIIKFRTMINDAERQGPAFATPGDPRVTRVGRILRQWRLDELPQLVNIIKGEMSFIGPRPEREVFIKEFQEQVPAYRPGRRAGDPPGAQVLCGYKEKIPYYSYRLMVRPGITGWAQVLYPYTASLEETREKLQYDLYYIKNMGPVLDLVIFLKTIRIVLFGRGR
jgi:exopolysaccharide biosynthesis polyprenyl glycosylphosphotransferase